MMRGTSPTYLRPLVTGCLLVAATLVLYGPSISSALTPGERALAEQAHLIASGGHDSEGRLLPLYFHVAGTVWLQPIPVYLAALFLWLFPCCETAIRWPSVVVGAVNVVMMYVLVRRIAAREVPAVIAACLLLLTPAHFSLSRAALDSVVQLPFVLGWLLCLICFLESSRPAHRSAKRGGGPSQLFLGTLLLGVGSYTAASAPITMTAYLVLTGAALLMRGRTAVRDYVAVGAGFVLPLLLLLP